MAGNPAVVVAGTGLVTQARPVKPGEFLEIYATGLGLAPVPTVTIGGLAAQVKRSGPKFEDILKEQKPQKKTHHHMFTSKPALTSKMSC